MFKVAIHNLLGRKIFQYLAAISATLCITSSEMHFGWTSPSLPILIKGEHRFQITSEEASWLAVILLAGTILGAVLAGTLADCLGRKKIILLTAVPLLVGWVMIALANSVYVLYGARLIAGISSGLSFSTIPMYLGEIAEPQVRGMLSSLCPVCVVFGVLLVNILGNYLSITTTAYIASIFPHLLFFTFIWMPESPYFLLRKGYKEEAQKNLEMLRGKQHAQKEMDRLVEGLKENSGKNKPKSTDLFLVRVNRKAAIVAFGLRTIQQFSGTTAITFYCKTIFEQARSFMSPNTGTIIYFSLQLVLAFFASFIVDYFGRRPMLIVSLVGSTLTLYFIGIYLYIKDFTDWDTSNTHFIIVGALFLNISFISIGVRNIPLLMMSEMFSTDIKSTALCVGTIYYSALAIISAKLFYLTSELVGMYLPFLIFATISMFSILFVTTCVPETKGKTLEDIQKELEGTEPHQNVEI